MPVLRHEQAELYYEEEGAGDPVVLIHGGFADYRLWAALKGALSRRFRVVTYSRRGYFPNFGQVNKTVTLDTHSADLLFLISRLSDEPVRLVAESIGACVAAHFTLRHLSKVRSMAIDEPPLLSLLRGDKNDMELNKFEGDILAAAMVENSRGDSQSAARRLIDFLEGSQVYDSLPEGARKSIAENSDATFADLRGGLDGIAPSELRELNVPTLLLKSDLGPPLLKRVVDRFSELAPSCEVRVVEGTSHGNIVDSPLYRDLVADFLCRN